MTREEKIKILKSRKEEAETDGYVGFVEALDSAIKALEQDSCEIIKEIPKDYCYDTETEDLLVYRNKYTGHEIHIEKPVPKYRLEQEPILDKITEIIEPLRHLSIDEMSNIEWQILQVIDKYKAESEKA